MPKPVKPQLTKAQEHDAAIRFTQSALESILLHEASTIDGGIHHVNVERVSTEAVRYGLRTLDKLKEELQRKDS